MASAPPVARRSALIPTLETERLRLRAIRKEDLDGFAALNADPEVMRYVGAGEVRTREATWRDMALFLGHWRLRGYGPWAAEDKASGLLVGRIGLWQPEGWPGLEVGWVLLRSWWGRGLATEGGRAAVDFAFATLEADHLISVIHPLNAPSIRVAEKLGETLERRIELHGREVLIYGLRR